MATTLITSATTIDISALLKDSKGVALVAGSKAYQSALTKIANFEAAVEGNRSASLTVGSTKFSYTKLATSGTTGPAITLKNGTSTFTSATTLAAGTPASTPAPTPAPTTTPTPAPTVAPTPAPTVAPTTYSLTADKSIVTEGTSATFTVTRTGSTTSAVTLVYNVAGDDNGATVTKATPGTDTGAASGTVTIAAGATTGTFTVSATSDTSTEGLEGIKVSLFNDTTVVASKSLLINDDPNAPVAGQIFTLDTDPNNISGGSANDTLFATTIATGGGANGATGTTLNVFDTVDLGAGTGDKVVLNTGGATIAYGSTDTPTLTGVEILQLNNQGGAISVAGALIPSATTLNVGASSATGATLTVTSAPATLTTLGLSSMTGTGDNQSVTYTSSALTGSSDVLTLNVSGLYSGATNDSLINAADVVISGGAASAGFETVTINATGSQSSIGTFTVQDNAAASTLTKLVLNNTSSGPLKVWGTADFKGTNSSGTVDASGSSAGVDVTVGTDKVTVTGGSGNDVIRFATAGDLDSDDSINLGAGTNTVIVADTTISSSTTALNTALNAITTATRVGFSAASSVAASSLNATTIVLDGASAAYTVTKLASTRTLEVDGKTVGALTGSASLGFNTLNLKLVADDGAQAGVGNTTLTGQSTFNINSTKSATQSSANTIAAVTNDVNTVVSVTGDQALTITSFSDSVALDASTFTGKLTVTGSNTASSIVGGAANDTITGGTGADTIDGGAGADTIDSGVDTTGGTTITGGLGADIITLSHTTGAGTAALNVTAAQSFATTGQYDTVSVANMAAGGNTQAITFTTGVTTVSLAAATSVTVGTTLVTAGGFLIVNSDGSTTTTGGVDSSVYQDSNGNGVIDAADLRVEITVVGTADTGAFTLSSGKLVYTVTGV